MLECADSFFFNDTATTEIYTLSLHDALPICRAEGAAAGDGGRARAGRRPGDRAAQRAVPDRLHRVERRSAAACRRRRRLRDRKSTRLNSSHANISYAVFCLKKNTQ